MRIRFAAAVMSAVMAVTPVIAGPLDPAGQWTANSRGAAKTPPMGWNSWNAFRTEVNEDKVMGAAKALVDTGLAGLGYTYVNIDDGWWLKRRTSDGRLQVRTAIFPSAATGGPEGTSFRPFVDKLHGMGLKAGIYTDAGRNACSQAYDLHSPNLPEGTVAEREVGLHGHVDQDIRLYFQEWGFDYIKVDACGLADYAEGRSHVISHGYRPFAPLVLRGQPARSKVSEVRALYQEVGDALARHNPDKDYVYSICAWGQADARSWGPQLGNAWRTSDDITPSWTRMLHTFDSAVTRPLYAGPGRWNDPDMLFIGAGDFDEHHLTEARSHFTLWAMINAPLLIGYDLRSAPQPLLDIWGNGDVVALNQDPLGNQAVIAYRSDDLLILVKSMSGGKKAVALFNRGLAPVEAVLTAGHLKFDGGAPVALKDLWTKEGSAFTGEMKVTLKPRETRVFAAEGTRALPQGLYLSEMPGSVHVAVDGVTQPEVDPVIHQMVSPWGGSRGNGEWPSYAGWGGAQADAGVYGTALTVAGRRFETGIGVLSNSRLEVRAGKAYGRFRGVAGVDDATRERQAPVRFRVYGDGRLLAEKTAAFGDEAVAVEADITGVEVVELVVRSEESVAAVWGDAALVR
jgi:alpha-galactosidase